MSSRTPAPQPTDAPPPPGHRRDNVLQAAALVFAEQGYKGATLRQIADAAGLLAGSIYHHFESKEALYEAVQAEGYRRMQRVVEDAIAPHSDPWTALEAACCAHLTEMLTGGPIARLTGMGLVGLREGKVSPAMQLARDGYENLLARLIDQLPLRPGLDRTLLRLQLLGALNWTLIWYRPDGSRSPAQIAQHLIAALR
ncbi:TetR/AcrR family transcriptional regulator [Hylemonella gracilis]|uniref:TetR family transcriptional regulator n=1 Tax=Hylemonella gracilis ATCC 19624 TaxID=887062 RepID=F3KUL4_9BURK|nr:TetR/AcrR family transcriptional regulator [Hylemonella gracilis]EGI76591.1 TetR family transcriptional regulator [Hylemonella gracilis ATCC 19624]